MKKTILFFILIIAISFFTASKIFAAGEQCTKYSGSCQANECNSEKLIGMLDCPNSAPFCCGNASAAQQQMLGGSTPNTPGSPAGGGNQSAGFGNPLGDKTTTIKAVLENITSYLRGIAGVIAVIFIIIGGIMYMVSGGSKETTERAKKTLICAIAGLAIVLAAPLFFQEINAVLSGSNPGSALQQILMNILKLLLAIVGFLAIISMVIGAIWMLTAVGDEERYELGKKTAGYSILGLVIALSALIIANQVTNLVGGSSSIINNAANSPMTGATVPSLPASSATQFDIKKTGEVQLPDGALDMVGITENNQYVYKDSKGSYWQTSKNTGGSGLFTSMDKSGINPVTNVGTLEGSNGTAVFKDTYGEYYKASGSGVVPFGPNDVLKK